MFLPVWPPFSVYRGHKQLDNSFCVYAQMELGVKNKHRLLLSRAHFGPGHCKSRPHPALNAVVLSVRARSAASCEDDHGDPAQSTSRRARGSASTAWPPSTAHFIAKTCGHCLSDTAVANSTLARTQLCFCTHERLFSGADVGLSLRTASCEPCTPEANSESSVRSSQHASPCDGASSPTTGNQICNSPYAQFCSNCRFSPILFIYF